MSSDKIEFRVGAHVTFPAQYMLFAQRLNCCSLHGELSGTIIDKRYNVCTDAMEYAVTLDGGAGEVTIREGGSISPMAPLMKSMGCLNKYDLVWYDECAQQFSSGANGEPVSLSPEVQKRYEENLARAKEFVSRPFGKAERLVASGRQAGKIQALISASEVQKQFAKHLYPMPGQDEFERFSQAQADALFNATVHGLGVVKVTPKPHIMGLDAESIDPEAFKAFGKTL